MEKNYIPELSIRTVKMDGNVVITQPLFGQIQLMLVADIMSARQDLNEKYTVLGESKRSLRLKRLGVYEYHVLCAVSYVSEYEPV